MATWSLRKWDAPCPGGPCPCHCRRAAPAPAVPCRRAVPAVAPCDYPPIAKYRRFPRFRHTVPSWTRSVILMRQVPGSARPNWLAAMTSYAPLMLCCNGLRGVGRSGRWC